MSGNTGRAIGRFALVAGGIAAGFLIPGGGAGLAGLLGGIGGFIGNIFLSPRIKQPKDTRDLKVQLSTYGAGMPRTWGLVRVGNNRIWVLDNELQTKERKESAKGGGKRTVTEYFSTFADYISDNPQDQLIAIIWDNKVVYRTQEVETQDIIDFLISQSFFGIGAQIVPAINTNEDSIIEGLQFTFYDGSQTQPDPVMEAHLGVGKVPAYSGESYIVFNEAPLKKVNNHSPIAHYVVSRSSSLARTGYAYVDRVIQSPSNSRHLVSWRYNKIVYNYNTAAFYATRLSTGERLYAWDETEIKNLIKQYVPNTDFFLDLYTHPQACIDELSNILYVHYQQGGFTISSIIAFDAVTGIPIGGFALDVQEVFDVMVPSRGASGNVVQLVLFRWTGSVNNAHIFTVGAAGSIVGADDNGVATAIDEELEFAIGETTDGLVYAISSTTLYELQINPTSVSILRTIALSTLVGGSITPSSLTYEPWSDGFWLYDDTNDRVYLVNRVAFTASVITSDGSTPLAISSWSPYGVQTDIQSTDFWVHATNYKKVDLTSLQYTGDNVSFNTDFSSLGTMNLTTRLYNVQSAGAIFVQDSNFGGGDAYFLYLDNKTPDGAFLKEIIDDVSYECGFDLASEIEDSDTADIPILGYSVNAPDITGSQVLKPLLDYRFVDAAEEAGLITYRERGGAAVMTIDEDDLGANLEGDTNSIELLVEDDDDELRRPQSVVLTFDDPQRDWQESTVEYRRPDSVMNTRSQEPIDLPVTGERNDMALTAYKMMRTRHEEYKTFSFSLGPEFAALRRNDPINVTRGTDSYRIRIVDYEATPDMVVRYGGVLDDASVHSDAPSLVAPEGNFTPQRPGVTTPSDVLAWDVPALRDTDATGVYLYSSAIPVYGAPGYEWEGALIQQSINGGTYDDLYVDYDGPDRGVVVNVLDPVFDPHSLWNGYIDVQMVVGAPESVSEEDFRNGTNIALIGSTAGGWEIIYFRDVTDLGANKYRLSNILRGRKDTDQLASAGHSGSALFVIPDVVSFERTDFSGYVDQDVSLRVVEVSDGSTGIARNFGTFEGRTMLPYSPVHLQGARDASNNVSGTFLRRARYNNMLRDNFGLFMDEPSLEFEVDFLDAPGGNVVDQKVGLTSEAWSWSAAEQTAASQTPGDPVYYEVYQVSKSLNKRGLGRAGAIP